MDHFKIILGLRNLPNFTWLWKKFNNGEQYQVSFL